ncbi:MAG TPA: peptidoglycan-binding domain-containing protein [Chthoniobacterales bacterium]|nr:peptidoglycan-binding domain-containing protein [Chthoniobacterales bacterium]
MRRLALLLAITLCLPIAAPAADESIRAAQARLKEGGFYFGQVNGVYDTETSAAVSRFQIRNGLRISGQLDAETMKSLGITAAPAPPAAAEARPDSETWRRLRKSDSEFLEKLKPSASPAGASNYSSVLVLSPERLRDYVGAFILAGLDPQTGAELEFFADRVRYYNSGILDREKIRRDLERYNQRWPERRFWLDGEVKVAPQADSRINVTFPLRYELRNGSKRSSGKVMKTLTLEVVGEDLQIVGVNERKA